MVKNILLSIIVVYFTQQMGALAVTCQTSNCHNDLKKSKFTHGPVKAQGCKICHQIIGKNYSELTESEVNTYHPLTKMDHPVMLKLDEKEINAACVVCHDELTTEMKNQFMVHKAITKKSCTSCHDPHSAGNKNYLKEFPTNNLCLKCHEKKMGTKYHDLSDKKKSCLECHTSHTSQHANLLKKTTIETCLTCHNKTIEGKNGRVKSISDWAKLHTDNLHTPAKKQECSKCHEIHGSDHKKLLKKEFQAESYTKNIKVSSELCFSCHKEELINLKEVTSETNFRNGNKNLHYFHGPESKKIKNCYACHDVHGSKQDFLIKPTFDYSGKKIPIVYKKLVDGGSCATACHKTMEYNRVKAINNVRDP